MAPEKTGDTSRPDSCSTMVVMSYRVLVVALVAACQSDGATGIEVLPGPEIRIREGSTSLPYELRFAGQPSSGFALDYDASRLDVTTIENGGATMIEVHALCSVLPPGETLHALDTITVSKVGSDTAPAIISVDITPWELDTCAVQVVGWAGPCIPRPADPPPVIELDIATSTQPICIEVSVPDSIDSLDVTFPPWGSLDPLELAGENLIGLVKGEVATRELVATSVPEKFRGRRDLDVRWGDAGLARLPITAGEPGDGVLRLRTGPANASEYSASTVKFASSYYEKPGTVPCVRAIPNTPTTSLIVRSDLAEIVSQGGLACGSVINAIELVTSIDSLAVEGIDIELERCTLPTSCGTLTDSQCCALPEATIEHLDDGSIVVPSKSVTEAIAVDAGGDRGCIDLDEDDVPEVLVRDASGVRLHRSAGTSDDVRFASPMSLSYGERWLAFRWFDGTDAKTVLIGDFQTALRAMTIAGWSAQQFAPRPATSDVATTWVPLGPSHDGGASYLVARLSNTTLGFACISPACRGVDAPSIDVSEIDLGGSAQTPTRVTGYTVADIDGDDDLDLVVVLDGIVPIGTARPIKMYTFDLEWNGHELVGHQPAASLTAPSPGVEWTSLQFASLVRDTDGDLIYVLARDAANQQHAVVEVATCGSGCATTRSIPTISRAFEIANVGNRLFAATDLGIWELDGSSWIQRDPERARTQQTTIPIPESSRYGMFLRACLPTTPTARPAMLFETEAGARWTFADVEVDTLPEP